MEQAALQGSVAEMEALGASLVVVTPEVLCEIRTLPRGHPFDAVFDQTGLTARAFPVLIDRATMSPGNTGWSWVSPDLIALYQQFGIDLAVHNGDDSWTLPLPATFVIDQHAIIRSADVRVDYRNRPEPAQTSRS